MTDDRLKVTSRSVWQRSGLVIRASNQPGMYMLASLGPMMSFNAALSRWERLRIGLWFIRQVFHD